MMAQKLLEEVAELGYFAGVIDLSMFDDWGIEVECQLITSLIIFRTPYSSPEGDGDIISNIVPVWIECHIIIEGEEQISDFDFEELKEILCTWE